MSTSSRPEGRLPLIIGVLLLAALTAAPRSAFAQPGDIARSLAADVGVVGELGEPARGHGFADGVKCRVRPQDEVWVVGTRHLDWPQCESDPPLPKFWRWDCGRHNWSKLTADAFFQSDSATVITMFYVHGNRVDSREAVNNGWYAYDAIARRSGVEQPVRFVILSWPSTRFRGSQINDIRGKAARTNVDGYYLGWLLAHIREDVPVSLMGFSYGARVITGGLHVAAGGQLCGMSLPADAPRRRQSVRTVLNAGALHNHWLSPECFHGQALAASDRMLILANSSDTILKWYHWAFKGEHPQPLGVTGMAWRDETGRVEQYDCCCCLGETHDSLLYLDSPSLIELWRPYMYWEAK